MNKELAIECIKTQRQFVDDMTRDAFDMAIKALEERQWIPCSERMPDEDYWTGAVTQHSAEVLMTVYSVADEKAIIDFGHTVDGKWYSDRADCYVPNWWKVLAWMPLPKPWKGEKHESC